MLESSERMAKGADWASVCSRTQADAEPKKEGRGAAIGAGTARLRPA